MAYILKKTKIFIFLTILFLIAGACLLLVYSKMDIFLFINSNNSTWADIGLKYLTILGDGMFTISVVIIFLFWKLRYSIILLGSYLSSGLMSQLLKKIVFPDSLRPAALCEETCHFIEGIEIHDYHSFPSGHATSAFALFLCMSFFSKKEGLQGLFFMLALATAYSRIYLAQHFFVDVYFGALIGVIFALVFIMLFTKTRGKWLDHSILNLRSRKIDA